MGTRTRLAGGLLGMIGAATVAFAPPAAAAEPHDLSRTDTYDGTYRDSPYTCTLVGRNVLEEDGDGFVSASITGCGDLTVFLQVSYVDETGTPVRFTASATGHVSATVQDVSSDLQIAYSGSQLAGPSTPSYRLPK